MITLPTQVQEAIEKVNAIREERAQAVAKHEARAEELRQKIAETKVSLDKAIDAIVLDPSDKNWTEEKKLREKLSGLEAELASCEEIAKRAGAIYDGRISESASEVKAIVRQLAEEAQTDEKYNAAMRKIAEKKAEYLHAVASYAKTRKAIADMQYAAEQALGVPIDKVYTRDFQPFFYYGGTQQPYGISEGELRKAMEGRIEAHSVDKGLPYVIDGVIQVK
ncbi:hypothetical protein [Aneurinibacillus sp. UBA3580]|jgi:chromosome segregation ATPase|uniref:hypothetical protein n=1 Tax=Aneurinibacillus sp. UBA3580 TaxID=1946041 RepID=UPI00257A190F|nr:hypothetical protein [Aneurinibacillus sp. UBA3580]